MSYVIAAPDMLMAAATHVAAVGSTVNAAHLEAAAPTTALLPPAADEVSSAVAGLFSRVAQEYHALAGQAAAFNQQFVQRLTASANSYAATELASAASMQPLTPAAGLDLNALVAALPGQLLNVANGLWNLLATATAAVWNVAFEIALIPPLLAFLAAGLAYFALGVAIIAVQASQLFVLAF
ncbi:PE family protein [Mycobacterium sp. 050134]|uniref:PE family protein n=1 Tax=Mycobacterium sp. 050134 TaxID=3096111 RepID=UPI002ED95E5E